MGTNTWVGERLEEVKSCLQQVVVDPAYIAENYVPYVLYKSNFGAFSCT